MCEWEFGWDLYCSIEDTWTDADGYYSFSASEFFAQEGVYTLRFSLEDDYWTTWLGGSTSRPSEPIDGNHFTVDAPEATVVLPDVTLASYRHLTGRVVDAAGRPLPDTEVELRTLDDDDWLDDDYTNGAGEFRLRIPGDADQTRYVVVVWPDDGDRQSQEVTLSQEDQELSSAIVITAVTISVVSGCVVDAAGTPLEDIWVQSLVWYTDDGEPASGYFDGYRSTYTGEDGCYTVRVRPDQRFTVYYEFSGYLSRYLGGGSSRPTSSDDPDATRLAAPAGEPNPDLPKITLERALVVTGTVVTTAGDPVEDVQVSVYPAHHSASDAELRDDYTDEDGRFRLPLGAGEYDLVFQPTLAWLPVIGTTRTITVSDDVTLDPIVLQLGGNQITGRVINSTGAGVSGAIVRGYLWDSNEEQWVSRFTATTGSGGQFSLGLSDGQVFTVRVQKGGYQLGWLGSLLTQPEAPGEPASAVSADGLVLPDITLFPSDAKVGKVAGQDLDYCTANALRGNDDGSTSEVQLPFELTFFGQSYRSLYVNNNGNVSFGRAMGQYTPGDLASADQEAPLIAAFFADVDTRSSASFEVTYGSSPDGKTFCVNWANVGYYSSRADKLNIFQLLLTSRTGASGRQAGDFDITMNYDQIQWETGGASGGSEGLGGTSAGVGYTAGTGDPGTYFELEGSRVPGSFLDGQSTSLVAGQLNSSQVGRYRFEIRQCRSRGEAGWIAGHAHPRERRQPGAQRNRGCLPHRGEPGHPLSVDDIECRGHLRLSCAAGRRLRSSGFAARFAAFGHSDHDGVAGSGSGLGHHGADCADAHSFGNEPDQPERPGWRPGR